jgi:hypothetical protein
VTAQENTAETPAPIDIAVTGGNPSATEIAAATAVLTGVLQELAGELGKRDAVGPTAWQRSQRPIRRPVHAGPGMWRGFSA